MFIGLVADYVHVGASHAVFVVVGAVPADFGIGAVEHEQTGTRVDGDFVLGNIVVSHSEQVVVTRTASTRSECIGHPDVALVDREYLDYRVVAVQIAGNGEHHLE